MTQRPIKYISFINHSNVQRWSWIDIYMDGFLHLEFYIISFFNLFYFILYADEKLVEIEKEKRLALIDAWEENEKAKAQTK